MTDQMSRSPDAKDTINKGQANGENKYEVCVNLCAEKEIKASKTHQEAMPVEQHP